MFAHGRVERTTVGFRDGATHRQTKTHAARFTGREWFKQPVTGSRRHAGPIVGHHQAHMSGVVALREQPHPAVLPGLIVKSVNGIGEEIAQNELDLEAVNVQRRQFILGLDLD